ncbi:hypothetical protein JCM10207_002926 [Rhodosporidiobolus poonsookiae]
MSAQDVTGAPVPPTETPSATTEAAEPLTNTARNRQNHREAWPYGNYRNYYNFRPASSAAPDAPAPAVDALEGRLALLDPALFRNKALLDLGTNSGKIPLDALRHLGARRATGVDIDPLLVEDAQAAAEAQGYADDDPQSDFLAADFMREGWFSTLEQQRGRHAFDIVTLFSVTKWLHLHNGDAGMQRLFRSLFDFLPPGGVVVVEPQEWDNYKRAAKKNKDLREVFKAIEMRPPFEDDMRSVGFRLETRIEREEGGFSRPLLVWRKEAVAA